MPVGVYERTAEHLAILAKARTHIKHGPLSEETKRKIGDANRKQITFECDYCGNKSSVKPSQYKRRKRHFCSQECYHRFRAEYLPKEEQPRFGSGLSVDERAKRKEARSILNHAVRDGKIKRLPCQVCGEVAEAHHDDYNKPLEVKWLCFKHHRLHHDNPELLEGDK